MNEKTLSQAVSPKDIVEFWYSEPMKKHWFSSTEAIDGMIRNNYAGVWRQAATGAFDTWKSSAEGCLALVIILDQFPLNMFRGDPLSFSTEQQAVEISKYAIEQGFDIQLNRDKLGFLYMPLMHSESMEDQDLSVERFIASGLEQSARFAQHHREIVRRFGRFPHRNEILGRTSTKDELDYLSSKEAFKG